jgi:hypothetical protein
VAELGRGLGVALAVRSASVSTSGRQPNHEAGAAQPRSFEFQDAAVVANDVERNRQAEARAFVRSSRGEEGIENLGAVVVSDTRTVVLDANLDLSVAERGRCANARLVLPLERVLRVEIEFVFELCIVLFF